MLSKLIKHEFRATGRILLPTYLLLLVAAGFFSLSMALSESSNSQIADSWLVTLLTTMSVTVFVVSIIGVTVLAFVLIVQRFYKNFMTDEGYLMFTLPVSTDQLICSKLLVAVVWTAATAVMDALAISLAVAQVDFWGELTYVLNSVWKEVGVHLILYALEAVVLVLLSAASAYLMIYAAIALGHSFSNHKLLLSVAFYFGFSMAVQIVVSSFTLMPLSTGFMDDLYVTMIYNWSGHAVIHGVLLLSIAISTAQAVIFYIITRLMLRKRLNLQ